MPLFYFDLVSPGALELDEIGLEFSDIDLAYLDACRAVLEISDEMTPAGHDPTRHRFEVRDARGRLLLDIPFAEMLPASRPPPPFTAPAEALRNSVQTTLARNRELRDGLSAGCIAARDTLAQVQATLARARSH